MGGRTLDGGHACHVRSPRSRNNRSNREKRKDKPMPRNFEDGIESKTGGYMDDGDHEAIIMEYEHGKSDQKETEYVEYTFQNPAGQKSKRTFWLTEKAIGIFKGLRRHHRMACNRHSRPRQKRQIFRSQKMEAERESEAIHSRGIGFCSTRPCGARRNTRGRYPVLAFRRAALLPAA